MRTYQAIGDVNDMGILSATTATIGEQGFHVYKSTSTCLSTANVNGGQAPGCFQGKFTKFRSPPSQGLPSHVRNLPPPPSPRARIPYPPTPAPGPAPPPPLPGRG